MSVLSSLRRHALNATTGHRVVYHHVPKCGGTSIERALRRRYALSYATFPLDPLYSAIEALRPGCSLAEADAESERIREVQLLTLLNQDCRCIAGHVYFSEAAHRDFADRYHFVTTLREPVAFFQSFYGQMVSATEPRWQLRVGFEDFLETELAALFGKFYLLYFAPPGGGSLVGNAEELTRAKRNLAKCRVVGVLEDMDGFERRLRAALGVGLSIGHANKRRRAAPQHRVELTPAIRRKIEDLSAVNLELYAYAKQELAR